jgi:hypothetical protein
VTTAISPADAAAALAQDLAVPPDGHEGQAGLRHALARGATGIALLHIERSCAGRGSWATAHAWLAAAAGNGISTAGDAGLYYGTPGVAFALHAAASGRAGGYVRARAGLDTKVTALACRRAHEAGARMDRGELPSLAEFDLIYGLSGIGAHLLRHAPGSDALARVLSCLVRLTEPVRADGEELPGWWSGHGPGFTASAAFPGGHANLGLAHGISGPLALLSLALRRGITVADHRGAILRICAWLDSWHQDDGTRPWWPQWITREDHRTGYASQPGPGRPSWCYGTPGIARAQQLAGIALGDAHRQQTAEQAMVACLADPSQLARLTDAGLCHGWAGLFQTAWRSARDAASAGLAPCIPQLASCLAQQVRPGSAERTGFLDGTAGVALALHTAAQAAPPASGWDSCLLIA